MHQTTTLTGLGWRASAASGLRVAWRQRRLVLLVWSAFIALSLFASLPTWRACDTALSRAPEGDRLLNGLNAALIRELTYGDAPSAAMTLPWMALGALCVALLWNPFVSGGVLSVLLGESAFFSGGARFYGRLTRLLLVPFAIGALITALVGMALFGIQSSVAEAGYERMSLALLGVTLAILAGLAGLFSLVLDYARIGVVRDGFGLWRAITQSLRLLVRRPLAVIAFGLTFALLLAIAIGLYVAINASLTFLTWTAILSAILLQQLFSVARTGLRVAMIAGELRMLPTPPPPPPPPAPTPAPAAPVDSETQDESSTDFPVGLS